jgi:2-polyprenyl-6-methoxyphenol hydroxylase-like FAD-dependent oxidoreductase
MAAVKRVLVVGGGVGGLTAGVALRRAGIDADLVEINPNFKVYGVGIIQPNNTLRALDRVGLAQQCVELGTPFPGWKIFGANDNFLMEAPNTSRAAPGFPPNNGITRPNLQKILSEAAIEHGVNVKLDTKVTDLQDRGDLVDVTLSDGSSGQYDLVIGCDGIYSDTRRRVFGDAGAPHFTGQSVWRYNLPRGPRFEWGEVHAGPNTKVGLVPIKPDLMYMFVVTAEAGNPRMPPEQLADLMRQRLSGYRGIVAELRGQIVDPAGVVYKPMEALLLPAPWYKGRVIIIGDAAHATTPHLAQGAAMAIEDAVLLGGLLGRSSSLNPALQEFVSRRFERVKFVKESSDQIAAWEMEEWRGVHNPQANPGALLGRATAAMHEDY